MMPPAIEQQNYLHSNGMVLPDNSIAYCGAQDRQQYNQMDSSYVYLNSANHHSSHHHHQSKGLAYGDPLQVHNGFQHQQQQQQQHHESYDSYSSLDIMGKLMIDLIFIEPSWLIHVVDALQKVIITRITRMELHPIPKRSWRPTTPSPSTRAVWSGWAGRRATSPTTGGGSKIEATASCGNSSAIFFTTQSTAPVWSAGKTSTTVFSASFKVKSWPTCGAPSRTIRAWRTKNSAGRWGKTCLQFYFENSLDAHQTQPFWIWSIGSTTRAKCFCRCWAAVWSTNSARTPSSGSRKIPTSSSPVWTGRHERVWG